MPSVELPLYSRDINALCYYCDKGLVITKPEEAG